MDPPEKEKHGYVVKIFVPSVSGATHDFESHEKSGNPVELLLSHLPSELLLENILNRLSSGDRIRFGATSKENLSLVATEHGRRYEFRPIDKLPWLATFPDISYSPELKLFDPLHHQGQPHYATYQIKQGSASSSSSRWRSIKKGWLFGLGGKHDQKSLLLFSPFNKRIIKLPDLDLAGSAVTWPDLISCQFTFSSDDPSSPDCVYLFLTSSSNKLRISTLHHQQQQQQQRWKTMVFDMEGMGAILDVVYHDGCFYCISRGCQLSAFDVSGQSWGIITPSSQFSDFLVYPLWGPYMVVCEGKLNLAFAMHSLPDDDGSYNVERDHCRLFEFSSSTRTWVEKSNLGNHAFFLGTGRHTAFVVPVSSCDKDISNRMYFYCLGMGKIFYYSFDDGRCHAPKDGDYWSGYVGYGIWIEPLSPSELA